MNKTILILSLGAAICATATAATTFAYNFTERWHAKTVQGEGTLFGTDNWTDSINYATASNGNVAANSTDLHAVTTPVGASDVTVAWSSNNMYQGGDEGGALENQMFRRYLDDGTGVTITLTGMTDWLAAEGAVGYIVTFYHNTDTANSDFADINVYSGVGTGGTLLETRDGALYDAGVGNGGGSRGINSVATEYSADEITFHSTRNLGQTGRATFSGMKVVAVVPEPSSTALLGLGGLALIMRRRK